MTDQIEDSDIDDDDYDEVKEIVKQWLLSLQKERKCAVTSAVNRIVQRLNAHQQFKIIEVISEEILKLTVFTGNEAAIKPYCHVVNGCFDNFPAAIKAIDSIIVNVFNFICKSLKMCENHFSGISLMNMARTDVCELVINLSRLGSLVLKLRRLDGGSSDTNRENNNLLVELFPEASLCCTSLISYNESIAIDTKINLGMMLWLMKEIAVSNRQILIELLDEFSENLEVEGDTSYLIFIMASAAVNLYSAPYVTASELMKYLTFFVSLCQRYSSDTGMLLMGSRSLQVVARHSSYSTASLTLATHVAVVVFMLLEHPVPCVRHAGRDLLQLIVKKSSLRKAVETEMLQMPSDRRCFFIGLASLADETDARSLLNQYHTLNQTLMTEITDSNVTSDVCFAVETIALNDSLVLTDFEEWCNLWIMPLVKILPSCVAVVAGDIEKLLHALFKIHPEAIQVTLQNLEKEMKPKVHGVLFCLKANYKLKNEDNRIPRTNVIHYLEGTASSRDGSLYHENDDVRLLSLAVLTEGPPPGTIELNLILKALPHSLNSHQPATRQKLLTILQKFLTRLNKWYLTNVSKIEKNEGSEDLRDVHEGFIENLVDMCYDNIFAGANYNRLFTVLSILVLCKQILDTKLKEKTTLFDASRWPTLTVALSSTFEENKLMAVQLSSQLPFSCMPLNEPRRLVLELRRAFGLIQELEPPNTLLGCGHLLILLHVPVAHQVLLKHFSDGIDTPSSDVHVLFLQILSRRLSLQLSDAQMSKILAVKQAPMYGTMYAIRQIFTLVNSTALKSAEAIKVLRELVEISFEMTDAVTSVVNNASPEGHLPMDFQQLIADDEGERKRDFIVDEMNDEPLDDVTTLIEKFKCANVAEEKLLLTGLICGKLEAEVSLQAIHDAQMPLIGFINEGWIETMSHTKHLLTEYDCYHKFFLGHLPIIKEEPKITAQALLLYSWRTIKEACLYLGRFVSNLTLQEALAEGLVSEELVDRIGMKLRKLLCEIKHRGAFEHADVGFQLLCMALWQCPNPSLHTLPLQWLKEALHEMLLPPHEQSLLLTTTRRSAGLPLLVQTVVTTEFLSNFSTSADCLRNTMFDLLIVAENSDVLEPRLHALNILRALFKHANLGKLIVPYVSKALEIAIRGSRSPTWSERNCSNLVFSALMPRIFGALRSRDNLSRKNKMTSRTFFQRYPDLYDFLLEEISFITSEDNPGAVGVQPQPSLYLILLLLSRLYPPTTDVGESVDLTPFVQMMAHCAGNPVMKIRVLAARALVPFVPAHLIPQQLRSRLNILRQPKGVEHNLLHGLLLQVLELLDELKYNELYTKEVDEMEMPLWMIPGLSGAEYPLVLPLAQSALQMMRILVRHYPNHPCNPAQTVLSGANLPIYTYYSKKKHVGADAFLVELVSLQLECIVKEQPDKLQHVVLLMSDCGVTAVEDLIQQFIYCAFTPPHERDADFDFSLTQDSVNMMGCLSTVESSKNIRYLLVEMLLSNVKTEFHQVNNMSQLRLRVINNGYFLLELIERGPGLVCHVLNLIGMYGSYWERNATVRSPSLLPVTHIMDSDLGRIVSAVVGLMEGDKPCRLAVASLWHKVTVTHFNSFDTVRDPGELSESVQQLRGWLCLFQLLVDEDEGVQKLARRTVVAMSVPEANLLCQGSLWSQQTLLQYLINHLFIDKELECLLLMALLTIKPVSEDTTSQTMELFKRGDPNLCIEHVALTRLFTREAKLLQQGSTELHDVFPGGDTTNKFLYNQLAPHFACYGLRLKVFTSPAQLISELKRLEQPENADVDEFWWQVQNILSTFT